MPDASCSLYKERTSQKRTHYLRLLCRKTAAAFVRGKDQPEKNTLPQIALPDASCSLYKERTSQKRIHYLRLPCRMQAAAYIRKGPARKEYTTSDCLAGNQRQPLFGKKQPIFFPDFFRLHFLKNFFQKSSIRYYNCYVQLQNLGPAEFLVLHENSKSAPAASLIISPPGAACGRAYAAEILENFSCFFWAIFRRLGRIDLRIQGHF